MITVNKHTDIDNYVEGDYYYSPVVDGKECSYIAETEDIAMLLGLGIKYDGVNSQFARMAVRMLGIKSAWSE